MEMLIAEENVELMQSKVITDKNGMEIQVECYNTTTCKAYDNSYMLVVGKPKEVMALWNFGYFEDVSCMFYFYDSIK
jgi:hypothetical protein